MHDNISPHCTYREATQSQTAVRLRIDNTPDSATVARMKLVANRCFEPAREHFGVPIYISSFYRSPKLNKAIGGASKSQHVLGEAIDLDCDVYGKITNAQLFQWLHTNTVYDQLIWEYGTSTNPEWVHVSYRAGSNRRQRLRAIRKGRGTVYELWPR